MTPEQRSRRARIAAHAMHGAGLTNTEPARRALEQKWLREVDPDGSLPLAERSRRAAHARKAFYLRLSAAGVKSRQARG